MDGIVPSRLTGWPSSRIAGLTSPPVAVARSGASASLPHSFYPTKNLGALGDGGALTTNDERVAAHARRLRNGGQTDRYHHAEFGVNSRLDEMQAAVLSERLRGLEEMTRSRRALAARYRAGLDGVESVLVPPAQDAGHVYHLFPVLAENRDALQRHLKQHGVETLVHYPVPIPRQPALALEEPADCPVATGVCDCVLSLPLYPALGSAAIDQSSQPSAVFRWLSPRCDGRTWS